LHVVLASTSPYRRQLLRRICSEFVIDAPEIDETPHEAESAHALVARLAEAKARAVATRHPSALIIGSDQVALTATGILNKPLSDSNAIRQLQAISDTTVTFYTGVCVLNSKNARCQVAVETTEVTFRDLSDATIRSYVARDRPYDCAGAFKAEGLGIALVRQLTADDPTSLIGLPLIRLVTMLTAEGFDVLGQV